MEELLHGRTEEKAKAKLDEMVDNYLKPFAGQETKEKENAEPEPVAQETKVKVPKLKRTKKSPPTSPYTSP